jgi:hypothetical protein
MAHTSLSGFQGNNPMVHDSSGLPSNTNVEDSDEVQPIDLHGWRRFPKTRQGVGKICSKLRIAS